MKSYFFVPASKLRKLDVIRRYAVNEIIIDLEDAILSSEIETYLNELKAMADISSYWFRIPVRESFDEAVNFDHIRKFAAIGTVKVVLPKIKSATELIEVLQEFHGNIEFKLLIEHPRLLLEINEVLRHRPEVVQYLTGVGLGSHDLMGFLTAKHTSAQLDYPRKQVLYTAKSYNLEAIDIASMNILDKEAFIEELNYGEDNGFDAKFFIHPSQIKWFIERMQAESGAVIWAKKILNHLPEDYHGQSIEPFVLDGEIIERPHALKALQIIKKKNYGE